LRIHRFNSNVNKGRFDWASSLLLRSGNAYLSLREACFMSHAALCSLILAALFFAVQPTIFVRAVDVNPAFIRSPT
jgi:hypothetical protein